MLNYVLSGPLITIFTQILQALVNRNYDSPTLHFFPVVCEVLEV